MGATMEAPVRTLSLRTYYMLLGRPFRKTGFQ